MEYLLGIDSGTSATKTVLLGVGAGCVASATQSYPMSQPQNGWAEQDPAHWWDAVCATVRDVLDQSGVPSGDILGIGLSGQMHGLVMLDQFGQVLRPSIIWCDQRTARECRQLDERIGARRIIEITANPPMTGFTAAKILWVQNNEPDVWAKCAHILLPKDYIRYRLTGGFATEVSDASGMQLMDVAGRRWSPEILEALGIRPGQLGQMYESPQVTGTVHKAAALATGLTEGTPVVGGASDNSAAAVGTGVVGAGKAFTTVGSSAVVYAVTDQFTIDYAGRVHTLCASVPGKWTVMSCTQAAGLSLRWLRDILGNVPYGETDALAEKAPIGADKLLYLPYLMGERSPHPDPDCRGVFFGLSAIHTRAHLIRAVMEGVAFSQRECVDVFREMGVDIAGMLMTGGGAQSALWCQIMADVYGFPVASLRGDLGPAYGAALLAAVGAGVYPTVQDTCQSAPRDSQPYIPTNSPAYEPYYRLYKKLYCDLKGNFAALAAL